MPFRLSQPEPVCTFEVSGRLPSETGKSACDDLTPVRVLVARWLQLSSTDNLKLDVTRKLHLERTPGGEDCCDVYWVVSGELPPNSKNPFAHFDTLRALGSHLLHGLNLGEGYVLLHGEHGPQRAKLRIQQED